MANDVVWYHSTETGAPTMNNAAGSLIAVLDACLITGFRQQTLTGMVVAGNVATATLSGHGYANQMMVEISGAGISALNGRKLITVTESGTFTFPAPGVADTNPVGGTIVAKRSPLGWTKPASGTNLAIYARSDVGAATQYLRVDDTGASPAGSTYAYLSLLESYTDTSTYTSAANGYWLKGANNTTPKHWILVGDSRTFYLWTEDSTYTFNTYGGVHPQGFGDIVSFRAGDAYRSFIAYHNGTSASSNALSSAYSQQANNTSGYITVCRQVSQLAGGAALWPLGINGVSAAGISVGGNANYGQLYPSPVDNGVPFSYPVMVAENNSTFKYPVRGILPGIAHPLAQNLQSLHKSPLTGLIGTDRTFLPVNTMNVTSVGVLMLDITGPWY